MAKRAPPSPCVVCGRPRRYPYKSTPVCCQHCGHILMLRLWHSIPGILELLPPKWKARTEPMPAWKPGQQNRRTLLENTLP